MAWTQEAKDKLAADYFSLDPTPENTVELVHQLAEDLDVTANGVRMVLSAMEVYVKKAATTAATTKTADGKEKPKRLSKADAAEALMAVMEEMGITDIDEDIIDKLTGKASQYFTKVFQSLED